MAADVLDMLLREGWSCEYLSSSSGLPPSSSIYRNIHGLNLTRPGCGDLDVHWHALHAALFAGADHPFWNDSVALRVRSADTRALNPSDQLLHACVHGFTRNVVAPIRWIADAVTVLRTSSVDWSRVLSSARELRVTFPLAVTLSFLKECFQAEVPEDILEELTASHNGGEDRRYFDALDAMGTAQRRWSRIARYHYEKQRRIRLGLHPLLRWLVRMISGPSSFTAYVCGSTGAQPNYRQNTLLPSAPSPTKQTAFWIDRSVVIKSPRRIRLNALGTPAQQFQLCSRWIFGNAGRWNRALADEVIEYITLDALELFLVLIQTRSIS